MNLTPLIKHLILIFCSIDVDVEVGPYSHFLIPGHNDNIIINARVGTNRNCSPLLYSPKFCCCTYKYCSLLAPVLRVQTCFHPCSTAVCLTPLCSFYLHFNGSGNFNVKPEREIWTWPSCTVKRYWHCQ